MAESSSLQVDRFVTSYCRTSRRLVETGASLRLHCVLRPHLIHANSSNQGVCCAGTTNFIGLRKTTSNKNCQVKHHYNSEPGWHLNMPVQCTANVTTKSLFQCSVITYVFSRSREVSFCFDTASIQCKLW